MKKALWSVAMSVVGLATMAQAAPTLVDGSFETMTGATKTSSIELGSGTYGSWTVASAPQTNVCYGNGNFGFAAQNELYSVALQQYEVGTYNPDNIGRISQTVAEFNVGDQVTLSWYDRGRGDANGSLPYEVLANGIAVKTLSNADVSNSAWTLRTASFLADSTLETFAFHALHTSPVDGDQATGIDNVTLTVVSVPEPVSMGLLSIATAGLLMRRRH